MRKLLIPLIAIVLGMLSTACIKDGTETNRTTEGVQLYNRAVNSDNGAITFSKSYTTVVIDISNMKMAIASSATLNSGATLKFEAEEIDLKKSNPYEFSVSSIKSTNGTIINGLQGKIDLSGGVMYMQYRVDGGKGEETVYATSIIAFPYTEFTATKDGKSESSTNAVMLFTVNAKDSTKATMEVRNLQLASNVTNIEDATYDTVKVVPTAEGYKLTGSRLKSNSMGSTFDITDFDANVTSQGRLLNATFKCMGYDVKFTGRMFKEEN